jgi:predicted enzyme related to lactoylglutathione lyase
MAHSVVSRDTATAALSADAGRRRRRAKGVAAGRSSTYEKAAGNAPRESLPAAHPDTRKRGKKMDWKLELIQVPVSDIDRAKAFYTEKAGFAADVDSTVDEKVRFIQLTPPGSGCSISLTTGVHEMRPGSLEGLQLVVADADAAREELLRRGVEVGEVQEFPWGRFVFFADPDGNGWSVQQLPDRS